VKGRSFSTHQTEEKFLENFDHNMASGTNHFEWGERVGVRSWSGCIWLREGASRRNGLVKRLQS
jgi:hypothetical protein